MLTIKTISEAMKGNDFWLDRQSEAATVVQEATARGYIRRMSWTQVEWDETGLEVLRLAESEAGRALARHGFKAAHQGGGLVNFERPDGKGGREHIIRTNHPEGWGPFHLGEPVALVDDDGAEREFPSLSAFLAVQFMRIRTASHNVVMCDGCLSMVDAGGISRITKTWGEDVITPDMVTERTHAPHAKKCGWCGYRPEASHA